MLKELMLMMLVGLILIIIFMAGVAFFTLLDGSVFSYIHLHNGQNTVGLLCIFLSFSDTIKLFCKEHMKSFISYYLLQYVCPVFSLFLSLILWMLMPYMGSFLPLI